ncbi:hypothetical protein RRG08_052840 [Elysia crispata]|uniref:Uncharacterized protein n=1 Tax=Elysia crispata TaxID=231223 RepID=A0AAE1DTP5_9GAST|nr:hypothetical protein RRG08_052840 [Elysia crispata]
MKLSVVVTFLALSGPVFLVSTSSTKREKRFILDDLKKDFNNVVKTVNDDVGVVKDKVNDVVNKGTKAVNDAVGNVKDTVNDDVGVVKDTVNDVVNKGTKAVNTAVGNVKKTANDVTGKINDAFNQAGQSIYQFTNQAYKVVYDDAQQAFNDIKQVEGKVDFKEAVKVLEPYIDSTVSNIACQLICEASADAIIGPEAEPFAALCCPPLCQAALAELQDLAESG